MPNQMLWSELSKQIQTVWQRVTNCCNLSEKAYGLARKRRKSLEKSCIGHGSKDASCESWLPTSCTNLPWKSCHFVHLFRHCCRRPSCTGCDWGSLQGCPDMDSEFTGELLGGLEMPWFFAAVRVRITCKWSVQIVTSQPKLALADLG